MSRSLRIIPFVNLLLFSDILYIKGYIIHNNTITVQNNTVESEDKEITIIDLRHRANLFETEAKIAHVLIIITYIIFITIIIISIRWMITHGACEKYLHFPRVCFYRRSENEQPNESFVELAAVYN
ncbi:uncharacterized protein LOC118647820 [Monomorium pharaonis]|uniref:uncharacterized protein LOC118647820 n=1 Tax=Monomorium pharaonis TaxID=307658 RepID=UPI0017461CE8|nr:uncharacterized protein LOC118647820 [Monomorium pharaonis]